MYWAITDVVMSWSMASNCPSLNSISSVERLSITGMLIVV